MNQLVARLGAMLGLRLFPFWVGDLLMALFVAMTWVEPTRFGARVPQDLQALVILEGLALHATPFILAVQTGKVPRWILWAYAPFILALALFVQTKVLLALFVWHLLSAAWKDGLTDGDFTVEIVRYVVVFLFFMGTMIGLYFVPVPELGWTAGAVSSELAWEKNSGELLYQAVPAFLTVYFMLRTLWHLMWRYWEKTGELRRMSLHAEEHERKWRAGEGEGGA